MSQNHWCKLCLLLSKLSVTFLSMHLSRRVCINSRRFVFMSKSFSPVSFAEFRNSSRIYSPLASTSQRLWTNQWCWNKIMVHLSQSIYFIENDRCHINTYSSWHKYSDSRNYNTIFFTSSEKSCSNCLLRSCWNSVSYVWQMRTNTSKKTRWTLFWIWRLGSLLMKSCWAKYYMSY